MISSFDKLLKEDLEQDDPQRLLLLFAKAEISGSKKKKKEKRGTLTPVMCVDKLPEEIKSFNSLVKEADSISKEWDFLITSSLSGKDGVAPTQDEAEPYLNQMTNGLAQGQDLSKYVIFDRSNHPIVVQADE